MADSEPQVTPDWLKDVKPVEESPLPGREEVQRLREEHAERVAPHTPYRTDRTDGE